MKYFLCSGTTETEITMRVNEKLGQGWSLYGGTFWAEQNGRGTFYQVVIKEE